MRYGFIIVFFLLARVSLCQSKWVLDTLHNAPKIGEREIDFLSDSPVIDGVLDTDLTSLPARQFGFAGRRKTDPAVPVNYRIAYGKDFLYLFIQADAEHLTFRDRAYQNGDGFVLLIAKPGANNKAADEFYELACSAVNKQSQERFRRVFWNYNVNKLFVPARDTKLEFSEGNGKINFELKLPWDDIRPYHPWISPGIGFNLSFCKAVEPDGQIWYTLVSEDDIGREFTKHHYAVLKFQKPSVDGNTYTFASFLQGHITEGDSLKLIAATMSDKKIKEEIDISVKKEGGDSLAFSVIAYETNSGSIIKEIGIGTAAIAAGDYRIYWNSKISRSRGSAALSVLQKFDTTALKENLEKIKNKISKGSYSTLQFLIRDLQNRFGELKQYETCKNESNDLSGLIKIIAEAEEGSDILSSKPGFIRKAYRSKVDSTLQPYVVYLPDNYDKKKTYPLMVFLHGSASDERTIQGFSSIIPEGFIAVGPLGRGRSNAFARDNAQEDIAEVINAVEENYSIDSSRILLSGFSMGGYGVYRTFYETPGKFRAAAIFSGGPNLGIRYAPKEKPPDFTDEKNLASFKNIPVFIFHGGKDLNVSLPLAIDVAEKLKNAGARVELQIEADKGHERPGKEIIDVFMKWVEGVMH